MHINHFLKLSVISMLSLFVVGCAGTSVRDTQEIAYSGQPRPTQVLIYNFAASPEDIQQNSSIFAKLHGQLANTNQTAEEIKLGREVADAMATELTQKNSRFRLKPDTCRSKLTGVARDNSHNRPIYQYQ